MAEENNAVAEVKEGETAAQEPSPVAEEPTKEPATENGVSAESEDVAKEEPAAEVPQEEAAEAPQEEAKSEEKSEPQEESLVSPRGRKRKSVGKPLTPGSRSSSRLKNVTTGEKLDSQISSDNLKKLKTK